MWKSRKILIALDGSETAEGALEAGCSILESSGEIVLVSIVPLFRFIPSPDVPILLTDLAEETARAQNYLDKLASARPGRRFRTLVQVSSPGPGELGAALKHLAVQEQCDLIVMASSAEAAKAVEPLLGSDLSLLLVPSKVAPRVAGRLVPRLRRSPVPRLASALASLLFLD